jgi:hypothetical protein
MAHGIEKTKKIYIYFINLKDKEGGEKIERRERGGGATFIGVRVKS